MKPGIYFSLVVFFLLALSFPSAASEWPQASGPFDLHPSINGTSGIMLKNSSKGVSLDGLGLEFVFGETTTLNLGYGDFPAPALPFVAEDGLLEDEAGKLGLRLTRMF
jgi:hypothetical protein